MGLNYIQSDETPFDTNSLGSANDMNAHLELHHFTSLNVRQVRLPAKF